MDSRRGSRQDGPEKEGDQNSAFAGKFFVRDKKDKSFLV